MDFRIKVPVEEGFPKIEHGTGVFLIGSCFVENIGEKLEWFKFRNLQNPTGIIFHPSPIRQFLQRVSKNKEFGELDVFEFNGGWQSLEAHSVMRRDNEADCIADINKALHNTRSFLENSSHVIISLGTAWGYKEVNTNEIAANCHKLPQKFFEKELSSIKQILHDLEKTAEALFSINEKIKIVFTVSPVRHLKDGVIENQQSKAHLISALHEFIQKNKHAEIDYFPSYEILMDELRDYRFYAEDMLHPNEVAVNYIWKLFSENWISEDSLKLNKKIDDIQKALSHRVRAENSEENKKILTKLQAKIEEIHKKHPEITFS